MTASFLCVIASVALDPQSYPKGIGLAPDALRAKSATFVILRGTEQSEVEAQNPLVPFTFWSWSLIPILG
jgi:hypothetical protein